MQIELSTDNNIEGKERLAIHVKDILYHALSRFSEHITRVEVHLSEETGKNRGKRGKKRCMMEARIERRKPIAVDDYAPTLDQAIKGGAKKLVNSIETILGRLHDAH